MSDAGRLILEGDPTLYGIIFRSFLFSGIAVILAALWGTPIAMLISLKVFKGKTIVKGFFNSLIGIPTVVLGLVLFLLFSKSGPIGFLGCCTLRAA
jgi:tungstate transport system permease protein